MRVLIPALSAVCVLLPAGCADEGRVLSDWRILRLADMKRKGMGL